MYSVSLCFFVAVTYKLPLLHESEKMTTHTNFAEILSCSASDGWTAVESVHCRRCCVRLVRILPAQQACGPK